MRGRSGECLDEDNTKARLHPLLLCGHVSLLWRCQTHIELCGATLHPPASLLGDMRRMKQAETRQMHSSAMEATRPFSSLWHCGAGWRTTVDKNRWRKL